MKFKYFGYYPESGFEVFETKEEAKGYAQSVIDYEREHAEEGWSEGTNEICWGLITECAKAGEPTKVTDEMRSNNIIGADCEYLIDYTLEGGGEWTQIEDVELEVWGYYWIKVDGEVLTNPAEWDGGSFCAGFWPIDKSLVSHVIKLTKPEA